MSTSRESVNYLESYYSFSSPYFKAWSSCPDNANVYPLHIGFREEGEVTGNKTAIQKMNEKIFQACDIQPGQRILDAGCGTGSLSFHMARTFPRTYIQGVDVLQMHISGANQEKTPPNLDFSIQDYSSLGLGDSTFNRVLFCESLSHAEEKPRVLAEAYRVLKKEGLIVIVDVFINDPSTLSDVEIEVLERFKRISGIPSIPNLLDFKSLLDSLGFTEIKPEEITHNVVQIEDTNIIDTEPNHVNSKESETLEEILNGITQLLAKRKLGYYFITGKKA